MSDTLCREYNLSVIQRPQAGKSKHYGEWRAEQEQGVVINALNNLRNDLIEDKRPTDIVDEVLIKTVDAPSKSKRVKQKDER